MSITAALCWPFSGLLLFMVITVHSNQVTKQHCCISVGPPSLLMFDCCKTHPDKNLTCCETERNSTTKRIHLAAFVPFLTSDTFKFKEAMLLAMDLINNRSDILRDYELVIHFTDTIAGAPSKAIYGLFRLVNSPPVKHMIVGPAYTQAVQPVAIAIQNWNLINLAYASVSEITDDYKYRNMFRMVPGSYSFNKGKIAFLKRFNWKRVAIIHTYDSKVFSPAARQLQELLNENNISTIAVEGFQEKQASDVSFQISKLKSKDARIIIGEFSELGASNVLCEAYKQKLYGPKYVWIIFGIITPHSVLDERNLKNRRLSCTKNQMKEVMQGVFGFRPSRLRKDNITTFSGLTSKDYINLMQKRLRRPTPEYQIIFTTYAFDSIFTAALALDRSTKSPFSPETFNYTSRRHYSVLSRELLKEDFEGISGPMRFYTGDGSQLPGAGQSQVNDRFGAVNIGRIRNESWEIIGQHLTFSDQLEFNQEIWPDGQVPKDQMIRKEKLLSNDLTMIVVIWLLAIVGTLLSLAFLYFNISYRENRLIKMSSPQLNNVIILGCLLCYISTILFGLDARFIAFETYGLNCNSRTAVMSIGFSLAFGAMFSKTWRVHKIFTAAKTLKKMAIKDIHLFGIVAALVIVDILYLSLWFGFDPLMATKLNFTSQEETINDVIYIPVLYQCTCKYKTYFIAAMYAYKGILLLFGLFLAWETRNVTIPALNDSKYIGMSVYNVVTLSLIGAIVTTALDNTIHYEAPYAISSLCLIICTTATLLLVFVPKVYCFILGSDDQSFNTATINNGVANIGRSHGSHAFRFESESGKPKHYSTKSVQTNHLELSGSADSTTQLKNHVNIKNTNINHAYDVHMDDIEIDECNITIPKTRYDQQLTENGLVTFMLTDM